MHMTPTREQMAYLSSVGASRAATAQPCPTASDTPGNSQEQDPRTPKARDSQWLAILVVVLIVILSFLQLAWGGETQNNPAEEDPPLVLREVHKQSYPTLVDCLLVAGTDLTTIRTSTQLTAPDLAKSEGQIRAVEKPLTSNRKATEADLAESYGRPSTDVGDLREQVQQLNSARAAHVMMMVLLFIVIVGSNLGLIATGRFVMEKRILQVQEEAMSQMSECPATTGKVNHSQPGTAPGQAGTKTADRDTTIDIRPTRPQPKVPPNPAEQMRSIVDLAMNIKHIRAKPRLATTPWGLGLATTKGHVRTENQDYGLCFKIDGHDVLVIADGCGGIPNGQRAAYLAVVSAAMSAVRTFGMSPRRCTTHVKDVAAKAILAAANRLALEGDKLNVIDIRGGLRTTLIVVIANKRDIGYAYIGDGGGCIVRSSGEVHRFLEPQKAWDLGMNVLTASLGPMMEGDPVIGDLKRYPGDLLIVGTDGIFDRVDNSFAKTVLRGCIQYEGDLQTTAEHIIEELALYQDSGGYVCDDNLTLGIMGDGTTPRLSQGFWSSDKVGEEHPAQVPAMEVSPCTKEVLAS